jgi:hypothetical protein
LFISCSFSFQGGLGKLKEVDIDRIIVTRDYDRTPHLFYNDVALIRLTEEVSVSSHARPACLWSGGLGKFVSGNITGWGQTKEGNYIYTKNTIKRPIGLLVYVVWWCECYCTHT